MQTVLVNGGAILGIVVGIVAAIALIAFIIYKVMAPKLKENDKPSEEQALDEELNRVLKPIEDEDTAKQIADYKSKEDE